MRFRALAWRHIPRGGQPCHLNWIHHATGRWNRQGEYGALYTALHPFGALLELSKSLGNAAVNAAMVQPRDLVSVDMVVDDVLDLRHENWILAYPGWPTQVLSDSPESYEICRSMADDAIALGVSAIRVPSSLMPGMPPLDNVILFPHTRPAQWSVVDGPDRFEVDPATGSISSSAWGEIFRRYPDLALPGMDCWV